MIPILDCKNESPVNIGQEFTNALNTVGFVYLKNVPELPKELVERAFTAAERFWSMPAETKNKYSRPTEKYETAGNMGYVGPNVEILDPATNKVEIREAYNITPHIGEDFVFPDLEVPEFRTTMVEFFTKCHTASLDIMRGLAKGLGIEDTEFFTKNHQFIARGTNATTLRALNYPPLPDTVESGTATRCGAHTDYGTITLLFQDNVEGLEVLDKNGDWIPATPVPEGILVNTGDLLENWTSGQIKAVKHRVVVPEDKALWKTRRSSFAFFVHPDDECLVKPLNGVQSEEYQPITARQILIDKFSVTY